MYFEQLHVCCLGISQPCAAPLQILQLEMERLSLAKAVSDRASKQRLEALDSQLKKLKAEQVGSCALSLLVHFQSHS